MGVRFDNCVKRGESAAERPMRIDGAASILMEGRTPAPLANLAAKGVPAVDLRPPVKAARAGGSVFYMHDTHWTFRGALAAFNAIVEADSHADWRIDPSSALGPSVVRKG